MKYSAKFQRGMTLVELMVSLVISLVLVAAGASFLLGSNQSKLVQDELSILQDSSRFATEIITKSIQQSGFQNYAFNTSGAAARREIVAAFDGEPDFKGFNNSAAACNSSFICTDFGLKDRSASRINNSDTLITRYQGFGSGAGDGSIVDCRGSPVPEPTSAGDRAYSGFEVRQVSGDLEPELRCVFNKGTFASPVYESQTIIRGVESLQFMYGVDTNNDAFIDKWLNASEVSTITSTRLVDWAKVKAIRVGMIIRSSNKAGSLAPSATISPLGVNFSQNVDDTLVAGGDGRIRKVVTFTVNLRNKL